jgi:phenylpyruvate tautomerase PptA (4-oxalocrotonate tautomerase family)
VAQVKIYALEGLLAEVREGLSDTIHSCLVDAFQLPVEKRFQRFFPLRREDFVFPADRSERYLILEISCFEGRSADAKKVLIRSLFERIHARHAIAPNDLEIAIFETPRANWGIRGQPGDELVLTYKIEA